MTGHCPEPSDVFETTTSFASAKVKKVLDKEDKPLPENSSVPEEPWSVRIPASWKDSQKIYWQVGKFKSFLKLGNVQHTAIRVFHVFLLLSLAWLPLSPRVPPPYPHKMERTEWLQRRAFKMNPLKSFCLCMVRFCPFNSSVNLSILRPLMHPYNLVSISSARSVAGNSTKLGQQQANILKTTFSVLQVHQGTSLPLVMQYQGCGYPTPRSYR